MTKQTSKPQNSDPKTNRLLAMLEPEDYDALMREGKVVALKFRKRLLNQDALVDAVYFPLTAMVSLLVTTDGHPRMEMATIGKEGVVGASEIYHKQGAMGLNLIQIPGTAVRIDAAALRKLNASRPAIKELIDQHLFALMRQILMEPPVTGFIVWKNVAPDGC